MTFLPNLSIRHKKNIRADASWAIYQILEHGHSAREIMPYLFERYDQSKDKAWLKTMVYGVLQTLPTLQYWLRSLLNKPLKNNQKVVEHLAMLGLYQLSFTRTSQHAAVSETVQSCKILGHVKLAGLINAILRNFVRQALSEQVSEQEHVKYNLPKWLYKKLLSAYPDEVEQISRQIQQVPPIWLRVNVLEIPTSEFSAALTAMRIDHKLYHQNAVKLLSPCHIESLPGYELGYFAVQDYAAQQAAKLLDIQAGDTVLDCCAAPGGKSAALLESQPQLAHLYAVDVDPKRLDSINENLQRLKHIERFKERLHVLVQDATELSQNVNLPQFDKILLDAPCSATGIIRRHPDIMWLRKANDIDVLVNTQQNILDQAWLKLKPGGTLLYATCSILPEENKEQIGLFLAKHSDAHAEYINVGETQLSMWQILPGDDDMDGFFYVRLIKSQKPA